MTAVGACVVVGDGQSSTISGLNSGRTIDNFLASPSVKLIIGFAEVHLGLPVPSSQTPR